MALVVGGASGMGGPSSRICCIYCMLCGWIKGFGACCISRKVLPRSMPVSTVNDADLKRHVCRTRLQIVW